METTFSTTYKATSQKKSSIKVTAGALQIDLHQMIVWVMHHQEDAKHLLPEYNKIRQQATERDEAQKTHYGHNTK